MEQKLSATKTWIRNDPPPSFGKFVDYSLYSRPTRKSQIISAKDQTDNILNLLEKSKDNISL